METSDSKGLLNGLFRFKSSPDGSIDKSRVSCTLCTTEFKYHRSSSSLSYHLRAKHAEAAGEYSPVRGHQRRQSSSVDSLTLHRPDRPVDEVKAEKLTTALAIWVASDRRPVEIVEDSGLRDVLRLACGDRSYVLPSRGTVVTRIHDLYETEKATNLRLLKCANASRSEEHGKTGSAKDDGMEKVQVKTEKEQHLSLPVITTTYSLMESKENVHQETDLPLKRKISSSEVVSDIQDDNELFLLSLLPSLKRLNLKKRMEVRMKFQQVLYNAEFEG